jgi:methyltransferase family protein
MKLPRRLFLHLAAGKSDDESAWWCQMMKRLIKSAISRALPESQKLRYLTYLPTFRRWQESRTGAYKVVADRETLYRYVHQTILNHPSLDYLEFGVYRGESLLQWLRLNNHPESRFYGFDTFTGLPQPWQKFSKVVAEKAWDAGGAIPNVADNRVSFYKGLFQKILPDFLRSYRAERPLVIHIDCDLYSASLYVLTQIDSIAKPGTVIIFDEFASLLHEFRALEDYCCAYMRNYEVVGATQHDVQIAVRMQ